MVEQTANSLPKSLDGAGCSFSQEGFEFGEGEFDHRSIYVTTTFNRGRGGKIWRIPVGVEGQALVR